MEWFDAIVHDWANAYHQMWRLCSYLSQSAVEILSKQRMIEQHQIPLHGHLESLKTVIGSEWACVKTGAKSQIAAN
jgi:hypothetical protein